MRVWERGSGETLACGTGACAVAVACALNGYTEDEVTVRLLGGDLHIKWDQEKDTVYMTGPAEVVFDGEWLESRDRPERRKDISCIKKDHGMYEICNRRFFFCVILYKEASESDIWDMMR